MMGEATGRASVLLACGCFAFLGCGAKTGLEDEEPSVGDATRMDDGTAVDVRDAGDDADDALTEDVAAEAEPGILFADDFERATGAWETNQGTLTLEPGAGIDGRGAARFTSDRGLAWMAVLAPETSGWCDYSVSCDLRFESAWGVSGVDVTVRGRSDPWNTYHDWYDGKLPFPYVSAHCALLRWISSSGTVLESGACSPAMGEWVHAELRARGSSLELLVDGVRVVSTEDSAIDCGFVGLSIYGMIEFDMTLWVDNFVVRSL